MVVALAGGDWIGMAATSDHHGEGFVFNEMTGVRRTHRWRGIAIAMKAFGMPFASVVGARSARTVNHPDNRAMITLNRRLGYSDAKW